MPSATITTSRLTPCQEKAMEMLRREGNIFLTGAAGTGKSFLLDQYLQRKPTDEFPIVASTGAAAVIVGGRTFHSFFGLGILEGGIEATVQRAMRNRRLILRLQRACCVIIDEISMLSGTTLLAADRIARRARHCNKPWGGLRIIAVGDFAQLPPVTPGNEQKDWAFLHRL
ncbi:MAG: AAA family ATPase, partial [Patescibacteria group bacterium]